MAQEIESTGEIQESSAELPESPKPRKKKEKEGLDPNAWMVTFSDLITLMMTFFVLLFSFNDPNPKKFEAISTLTPGLFEMSHSAVSQPVQLLQANSLMKENLEIFLAEHQIRNVEVISTPEGIVVTIPSDILFQRGSAVLSAKAKAVIDKIARYLNKTAYSIRIEGHTDNQFRQSKRYRDSWELSLARASNVLQVALKSGIDPSRLALVGKGDAFPRVPNTTTSGRRLNRRVDFVILN